VSFFFSHHFPTHSSTKTHVLFGFPWNFPLQIPDDIKNFKSGTSRVTVHRNTTPPTVSYICTIYNNTKGESTLWLSRNVLNQLNQKLPEMKTKGSKKMYLLYELNHWFYVCTPCHFLHYLNSNKQPRTKQGFPMRTLL
jgi:hypothetical protein